LNDVLSLNYGIKYLLNIIGLFSRKGMVNGINSKNAEIVLQYIIEFCLHNNFPKEIGLNNDSELKNILITDFCEKNMILN